MIRYRARLLILALSVAIPLGLSGPSHLTAQAASQKAASAEEHKNMQLVGFNDLQGRSAYQPTIHHYSNGRYIAFVGHHGGTSPTLGGSNGTSSPTTNSNTFANGGKFVIQTNNVEVDDRGYVYIVDRAGSGMHILRLTGAAAQIMTP